MTIKVVLNEGEVLAVKMLAALRSGNNRAAGVVDQRVDRERSGLNLDIEGLAGEFAFAKAFNLYPDFSVKPRKGSTDVLIADNAHTRADVKTNSRKPVDGDLMCFKGKNPDDSEIFVLVRGVLPDYEIVGWCYSSDLINKETLESLRQRDGRIVETHKLRGDQLHNISYLGQLYPELIDDTRDRRIIR